MLGQVLGNHDTCSVASVLGAREAVLGTRCSGGSTRCSGGSDRYSVLGRHGCLGHLGAWEHGAQTLPRVLSRYGAREIGRVASVPRQVLGRSDARTIARALRCLDTCSTASMLGVREAMLGAQPLRCSVLGNVLGRFGAWCLGGSAQCSGGSARCSGTCSATSVLGAQTRVRQLQCSVIGRQCSTASVLGATVLWCYGATVLRCSRNRRDRKKFV